LPLRGLPFPLCLTAGELVSRYLRGFPCSFGVPINGRLFSLYCIVGFARLSWDSLVGSLHLIDWFVS
jgi:hypothetical protein